MTAAQFIKRYEGYKDMTRKCSVVVVETAAEGILLARAESQYGVAYCASRTTSKAMGRAASAVVFGDYGDAGAFETPEEALAHFHHNPRDYH